MVSETSRRDVLKAIGIAALSSSAITGVAGARSGGKPASDRVETEEVSIFSSRDDPVTVATGSWVEHRFGWIDAYGESTPESLEGFLDAVELSVSIDGEPIDAPSQYWGDPEQNDDGDWIIGWEYVTKPKPPGTYTFTVAFSFPDGYYDGGEEVREPGTRHEFTGYYEVVPRGR